jgi:uncharacterized membrane protein YgcG
MATAARTASSKSATAGGLAGVVENTIAQAAAFTAMLAGTVGLLYVIGGTVLWLRFHEANLPADRAVALVPKNDLLVLGLRVMVIPALASGALLLALGSAWGAREAKLERLVRKKEDHERRLATIQAERTGGPPAPGEHAQEESGDVVEDADSIRKRVDELEGEILRGSEPVAARERLPQPSTNPLLFGACLVIAIAVALVVPFSIGSLAWPLVLVALLAYWSHLRPASPDPEGSRFPIWRLALAVMLGAAVISVARQTDRPVELLSIRAELVDPSALVRSTFAVDNKPTPNGKSFVDVSGILVAATDREIDIGDPINRVIASLPRSGITSMTIGPPLDQRAPPASLLSRLLGNSAWAVTPLELWCTNLRYGWNRLGDACRGDPSLHADDLLRIEDDRIGGIEVSCPLQADNGCRGFISVSTKEAGSDATGEPKRLPVKLPPVNFVYDKGEAGPVPIPIDEKEFFLLLPQEQRLSKQPVVDVPVHILLSLEAAGEAVVAEAEAKLTVTRPQSRPPVKSKPSKKKSKKKKAKKKTSDTSTTSGGGGGAGGGGGGGGAGGGGGEAPAKTPEPSATSEATPTPPPPDSNPLPSQQQTLPAPTPSADVGE